MTNMGREREYRKYYQICRLADADGPWEPRLNEIRTIIQQPDFTYKKEFGADIAIGAIIRSSYWLDKELFNESYLYQKQKQDLFELQPIHFELVDIGAFLLSKGFPIRYNPEEYTEKGPDQLAPYVKEFVKQCHKRYKLFYEKNSHKNRHKIR
jgi:hypothetical protein